MRQYLYALGAAAVIAVGAAQLPSAFADDPQVLELALPGADEGTAERSEALSGKGVYRSEKEIDRARARLREDLRQSRAIDNQAIAVLNSDIVDRETADRKTLARQAYARSGRNSIVERSLDNTHVSSEDARILSEWARDQKLNDKNASADADSTRMMEQYRKRYPSSEAAKAMQSWISTGDVSAERKEARQVLKSKNSNNKKN